MVVYAVLVIYVCGFGLRPLLEVILYRLLSFGGMLLSVVRSREVSAIRRFYLMGRAIKGMEFVRCTEVVRLSESPLSEVSLYYNYLICYAVATFYSKINVEKFLLLFFAKF